MTLGGALQIGRSGLAASQTAIDVTGNNLANVATRGYRRQTVALAPVGDQQVQHAIFVGRGVQVQAILRQVDEALEGRLRTSIADESASGVRQDILAQIESLENELSGTDLTTQLGRFFNAWSELANNPLDSSVRSVVVQQGQALASFVRNLRSGLTQVRTQADTQIDAAAKAVDDLLTRIAGLNDQIVQADAGTGGAHSLRDQRDQLLQELSQYLDISTVEQPSGSVDVFVGSLPLILDGRSRGVEVRRTSVDGEPRISLTIKADGSVVEPRSGKLGALVAARQGDVDEAVQALDAFANSLIFQVNRLHSQGQGTQPVASVTGTVRVDDPAAALNAPAAGLASAPGHGSFQVHLTQVSTGQRVTRTLRVNLDGLDAGTQTTLGSLAADLDGVDNLDAAVTSDGRLRISTVSGDYAVSFSDDSSGVLAALGINTFFAGRDARDMGLNPTVAASPAAVAAGQGHVVGDNRNALAIAALRSQSLPALNGQSLMDSWARHVEEFAVRLGQAKQQSQADTVVRESLDAQQQAVSGVNTDEEAINLLAYQRAYQGSARFLNTVDQLYQTLLELL